MHELSIKEKEYFQCLSFISIEELRDRRHALVLETIVDDGEVEVITLVLEKNSSLIMNNLKSGKLTRRLNLEITVTLVF